MKTIREFWFDTEAEAVAFQLAFDYIASDDARVVEQRQCPETDSFCVIVERAS